MTHVPSLGPRGEGWVVAQAILLVAVAWTGFSTGPDWDGPLRAVGILIGVAGLVSGAFLIGRGVVDLRGALTPFPRPRADAELVETGIYGLVRHPIYGGLTVASIGWALVRGSGFALIATAILGVVLWLKSAREEAWLHERFPGYGAYRARTRRFIPWFG